MKKLSTLVTTTLLTLGLMLTTTSAMADPTSQVHPAQKDNASLAVFGCVALKTTVIPFLGITFWDYYGWTSLGECVKWARHRP